MHRNQDRRADRSPKKMVDGAPAPEAPVAAAPTSKKPVVALNVDFFSEQSDEQRPHSARPAFGTLDSDESEWSPSHDIKPHFAPLCTKCSKKHGEKSAKEDAVLVPYIIQSKSFQQHSLRLNDTLGSLASVTGALGSTTRSTFHRSNIVREEVLADQRSIEEFYDIKTATSLGKGSYGSVVKAKHIKTGKVRAVKIVHKPKIENVTRLKREILIMKRLDHPSIIRLFEVYEDKKNLYLVLEICTGGELFDRIIKSGHFSERYAANVIRQILSAVAYCHQNDVIHRDLKPENLLFADPSPQSLIKVIDWGFAAQCDRSHKFSSVVGTPYYVAPEVLFGNYDRQCDVWSLGVILYILLCGYPPFHGKDNKEILRKVKLGDYNFDIKHWKKVSDPAKDLVRRMLTFDPRKRLKSQDALQHPWLLHYASDASDTPLSSRVGGDLIEKFKNFQRSSKLKKLAATIVAYQTSDKEIGPLREIFEALDKNGDGVLTIKEAVEGLQVQGLKTTTDLEGILLELDTDGNGTIDYTEFIAAGLDHNIYDQVSICRNVFAAFDLDGDGSITVDEIHQVLENNFAKEAFTREMIEEMVREYDTNHDRVIDFDEFVKMMRGNQRKKTSSKLDRAKQLLKGKILD